VTRMGRGLEHPQNIEPLGNLFCLIEMDVGPTVRIRSAPASSHCELCSIDEMRKALLLTYESANGLSRAMGGGARRPPHGRVGVPIRTNHPPGMNAIVQSPRASVDTTLNTLNGALASAQAQAQDFQAEQADLQHLELRNQTAICSHCSVWKLKVQYRGISSSRNLFTSFRPLSTSIKQIFRTAESIKLSLPK